MIVTVYIFLPYKESDYSLSMRGTHWASSLVASQTKSSCKFVFETLLEKDPQWEMADDLGTAYQGHQDDINEKLVLDLAWERQQKKVRKNH